jgi:hypothetical protein
MGIHEDEFDEDNYEELVEEYENKGPDTVSIEKLADALHEISKGDVDAEEEKRDYGILREAWEEIDELCEFLQELSHDAKAYADFFEMDLKRLESLWEHVSNRATNILLLSTTLRETFRNLAPEGYEFECRHPDQFVIGVNVGVNEEIDEPIEVDFCTKCGRFTTHA